MGAALVGVHTARQPRASQHERSSYGLRMHAYGTNRRPTLDLTGLGSKYLMHATLGLIWRATSWNDTLVLQTSIYMSISIVLQASVHVHTCVLASAGRQDFWHVHELRMAIVAGPVVIACCWLHVASGQLA